MITLFLGFAYAFVGTGVAQVLFKHQADGSITPNGSTLIGQNWSSTKCPGHPLGSCVFQGRPDALGPYAGTIESRSHGGGDNPLYSNGLTTSTGMSHGVLNRSATSRANANLGPRSKVLLTNTQCLVAYWTPGVSNPLLIW